MNAADMATLIEEMRAIDPACAERMRAAGERGYMWPRVSIEFYGMRLTPRQKHEMGEASALAACELQRIVEIVRAEKAGGIVLGRKS